MSFQKGGFAVKLKNALVNCDSLKYYYERRSEDGKLLFCFCKDFDRFIIDKITGYIVLKNKDRDLCMINPSLKCKMSSSPHEDNEMLIEIESNENENQIILLKK